ncbi:MAG: T9SS type A sorting domain-containing protein [Saprospiraceae bacterium]
MAVFPNPSDEGLFKIIIPENEEPNIPNYIYDSSGMLRYETFAKGTEAKVDINDLIDGLYLVRILLGREWLYAMVVVD